MVVSQEAKEKAAHVPTQLELRLITSEDFTASRILFFKSQP